MFAWLIEFFKEYVVFQLERMTRSMIRLMYDAIVLKKKKAVSLKKLHFQI